MSVTCACDTATYCNRLCQSKANPTASHPDLLCPLQNPAVKALFDFISRSGGRYLDTVVRILARWRMERELGDKGKAKEIEKRVWSGMARVNMEEKEKEKKEW